MQGTEVQSWIICFIIIFLQTYFSPKEQQTDLLFQITWYEESCLYVFLRDMTFPYWITAKPHHTKGANKSTTTRALHASQTNAQIHSNPHGEVQNQQRQYRKSPNSQRKMLKSQSLWSHWIDTGMVTGELNLHPSRTLAFPPRISIHFWTW